MWCDGAYVSMALYGWTRTVVQRPTHRGAIAFAPHYVKLYSVSSSPLQCLRVVSIEGKARE